MASKSSSWSDVWDRNGKKVAHGLGYLPELQKSQPCTVR